MSHNINITTRVSASGSSAIDGGVGQCTIIMLSPVLINMKIPVSVTLQGVRVKNVSTKGLSAYFSVVPDGVKLLKSGARSVPGGAESSSAAQGNGGVSRGMASSVILGVMDGVVHCNNCKFTTDLGLCSSTSGACIVENCSKSVFRHCEFETTVPDRVMSDGTVLTDIMKGPKVCMASSPSWGRAVFDSCGDTMMQGGATVWGGCSAV